MSGLEMRLLTPDDIPRLVSWEQERPYPWTVRHFQETINSNTTRCFVFWENGAPVGFAVLQIVFTEGHLQNIFVDPLQRKGGRGEKILRRMIGLAKEKGVSEFILDVDPKNISAVRLYTRCGLSILEERKKSYPRGEDAVIMRAFL